MAYSTQTDLEDRVSAAELVQLTDDAAIGQIDASVISRAITDADAEIDGYCGTRYAVPFATVPAIVRKWSVSIAVYNLFTRRRREDDAVIRDYDNTVRQLQAVSAGKLSLGADDPDGNPPQADRPQITQPGRVFSRDNLEGF